MKSYGWFQYVDAIYIAMEYVEYGDLEKHLENPIPEDEARLITRQLAEGLYHLHENGFTHRDLKPRVRALNPNSKEQALVVSTRIFLLYLKVLTGLCKSPILELAGDCRLKLP